jgi:hypothetical protein
LADISVDINSPVQEFEDVHNRQSVSSENKLGGSRLHVGKNTEIIAMFNLRVQELESIRRLVSSLNSEMTKQKEMILS